MENKYNISIIIPCYNAEKYVAETLESVWKQDFDNYEVICINDGSTDHTLDILKEAEKNHPSLTVISQENHGIGATRNMGIEHAQGKYLLYLDSDDLLMPNTLTTVFKTMQNNELDLLYFSAETFYDNDDLEEKYAVFNSMYHHTADETHVYSGEEIFIKFRNDGDYVVNPCLQMINRDFLLDSKVLFPLLRAHEDNLYTFQTMLHANRVMCLNQCLYRRRVHSDSIMTSDNKLQRMNAYCYCLQETWKTFAEYEDDPMMMEALYKHVRGYLKNIYKLWDVLDENEKKKVIIDRVDHKDYMLVLSVYAEMEEKRRHELEGKLKKTYAEKSEINAKLQKTYAEKSEINAKLKKAYAEKTERGIRIKELKKELKDMKEKTKGEGASKKKN